MTGRELIIYILQNGLEDEQVFKNGVPIGYIPVVDVATRENVGVSTVLTWLLMRNMGYIVVGSNLYVPDINLRPTADKS